MKMESPRRTLSARIAHQHKDVSPDGRQHPTRLLARIAGQFSGPFAVNLYQQTIAYYSIMLDELFSKATETSAADEPASYMPTTKVTEDSLDDFLGQKTNILKTKLEVFATEMFDRFRIRAQNLSRIADDQQHLGEM